MTTDFDRIQSLVQEYWRICAQVPEEAVLPVRLPHPRLAQLAATVATEMGDCAAHFRSMAVLWRGEYPGDAPDETGVT
ncbi:hypothetical protein [Amycolatopsis minnesotensis]|uniref:Uncharacterized protein n=1 Tax=Amycolatopsis minnesotensis TaxID=337894 RepID=A0ABP5EDB4_9PSEU